MTPGSPPRRFLLRCRKCAHAKSLRRLRKLLLNHLDLVTFGVLLSLLSKDLILCWDPWRNIMVITHNLFWIRHQFNCWLVHCVLLLLQHRILLLVDNVIVLLLRLQHGWISLSLFIRRLFKWLMLLRMSLRWLGYLAWRRVLRRPLHRFVLPTVIERIVQVLRRLLHNFWLFFLLTWWWFFTLECGYRFFLVHKLIQTVR